MEAGGAARAIYQDHRAHLIVVRGISDLADERRRDMDATTAPNAAPGAWRRYAMCNAVDLFAALVASPQFPWPGSAQDRQVPPAPAQRPAPVARIRLRRMGAPAGARAVASGIVGVTLRRS
jgi:hypothetical protein